MYTIFSVLGYFDISLQATEESIFALTHTSCIYPGTNFIRSASKIDRGHK
jgi:hypothetical protein